MKTTKRLFAFVLVLLLSMMFFCGSVFAADTGTAGELDAITDIVNGASVYAVAIIGILGLLTFFVQIFVQVTKNIWGIRKLPTDLYVILVSVAVCQFVLFGYAGWQVIPIRWYYIVLAIFMALTISFISMFGWAKLYDLYKRFAKWKK